MLVALSKLCDWPLVGFTKFCGRITGKLTCLQQMCVHSLYCIIDASQRISADFAHRHT